MENNVNNNQNLDLKEEKKVKKSQELLGKIDKVKRADTKKMIKIFSIVLFLATIIVMTLTGFAIDKNFNILTWISNAAIIMGIMVFGMFFGESLGGDKQKELSGGLYQTALSNYKLIIKEIGQNIIYFFQWWNINKVQALEQKKIDFLADHDIDYRTAELIIKYCDKKDINDLSSHPIEKKDAKGKIFHLDKLNEDEYELVLYALTIKFNINNAGYFLSATGTNRSMSVLERGAQIDKQIRFNKNSNRLTKIGFSLVISLIFGLFAVEQVASGNTAQVWVTLASRITALFGSLVSGWMSAVTDIRLKSEKIENKITVLKLFYFSLVKKEFIPVDEEELAKQKFEEYKKKEEEAKASVVIPDEIINEDKSVKIPLNTKSIPYNK